MSSTEKVQLVNANTLKHICLWLFWGAKVFLD